MEKVIDCMDSKKAYIRGAELFHFPLDTLKEHEVFEKMILDAKKKGYLVIIMLFFICKIFTY